MKKAEKYYINRIKEADEKIKGFNKISSIIGWIRLIIIIVGIIFAYDFYKVKDVMNCIITVIIALIIFAIVAKIHSKYLDKIERLEVIKEINEKGIKRLNGEYKEFEDKGIDLIEESHPFCEDLDIFGQNSLFQMINTTRTKGGRNKLGKILSMNVLPSKKEVEEKQQSIKELAEKVEWRQKLYVDATFKRNKDEELDQLIKWCNEEGATNYSRLIVAILFIAITFACIFAAIVGVIPASVLLLNFMVNYVILKILTNDKGEAINLFQTMKYSVKAYTNILSLIEDENFESDYLVNLKKQLKNGDESCKTEMKKLSSLLDWVGDSSGNAYFFIFNTIAFADVFILNNLNKWREQNGNKLEKWLDVMSEFEALASISNIAFDNEEYCYPVILENKAVKAVEVRHPLIGEKAVSNSYNLVSPKQVTLITGSNMSGKSTFLRTIGINLVLSYIGAPTCAKEFECSIMNIYTCMRTKDNLEESISSFYAEILRIKLIIEACKKGENVFFLLDEIFKGTNSRDRHIGATVLVKQLIENKAIGLLSTHDLELCDLENEMKEIENYNFREYYEDNKIMFDYKLRKGKSMTQNAVYLMRLAGIEISENL